MTTDVVRTAAAWRRRLRMRNADAQGNSSTLPKRKALSELGRMPLQSEQSSRFFPPSYKPDSDAPPISVLDAAKEKILSMTQELPELVGSRVRQEHLCLLTDSPGYAAFFLTSLDRHDRLLKAKPVLVQGWFPPQLVPALREPCPKLT
jgi:hypothetical protein